jgi:PPOX class probable F420-dependent enzyme
VDREEALRRLAQARVARLATADASGKPHVVPFVFALEGSTIYWAVDDKPKRSRELKRVANIRANPRVEVVVDHYEDDWRELWWVRASGTARIVAGVEAARATAALSAKYPPYGERPPAGPSVAIEILHVTGWSAKAAP